MTNEITATEQFRSALNKIRQAKAEADKVLQTAFKEMAGEVFKKHVALHNFGFRQYTPYFNDGDPCTFCCCIDAYDIYVNDEEDPESVASDRDYDPNTRKLIPKTVLHPLHDAQADAAKMLQEIGDDYLLDMFGNDVRVTIDRNLNVTTETYDHD